MRSGIALVLLSLALAQPAAGQNCAGSAKVIAPQMSEETRKSYEAKLAEAEAAYKKTLNADSLIWVGRRTAYLGRYKDAIQIFTNAVTRLPFGKDARMYRHRGHRYITLRCFDDAIKDLEKAAKLVKGKPDEIEPDGLPNARNIPTSTLQSNIWYHLGLAYYLKGDFENALRAYDEAEKVSKNPDMLVATKHWQYMTLRRLGKRDEAARAVAFVPVDLDIVENGDYYALVKIYKGIEGGDRLLKEFEAGKDSLGGASIGYGLGNRYLYHNKPEEAMKIFRQIVAGNQWASFGYIAAEAELERAGMRK